MLLHTGAHALRPPTHKAVQCLCQDAAPGQTDASDDRGYLSDFTDKERLQLLAGRRYWSKVNKKKTLITRASMVVVVGGGGGETPLSHGSSHS